MGDHTAAFSFVKNAFVDSAHAQSYHVLYMNDSARIAMARGGGRKIIGIDFDEIIYDLVAGLLTFFNEKFNTSFVRSDVTDFHLGVLWDLRPEEEEALIIEFCHSDRHHQSGPVDGAVECIRELADSHDLYIVTARGDDRSQVTMDWLGIHLPGIFKGVLFTNPHHEKVEMRKKKSDVCKVVGIDYFIDDHYKNALDVSPCVEKVFLLDTPWNGRIAIERDRIVDKLPDNVERVFSWREIVERINAIS